MVVVHVTRIWSWVMVTAADVGTAPRGEATSYVGRERELVDVARSLTEARLVTLTGPGGVGKTRLALRVLWAAEEGAVGLRFPDGAVFVSLAELRDPALVPGAVAGALGRHALSARPAMEIVIEHLRARTMLLVLDNCEHLLDACAELVHAVLTACPDVAVLATSRQSLGVDGEHVWLVPPLEVPHRELGTMASVFGYDSVRLFAERAQAVVPSFEVTEQNLPAVVELTRRLEGLPLAIELAAARIRSLSPAQIAARLSRRLPTLTLGARTAPQRQQTLRATIDWTYELCTEAERLVWARASVFAGSFELEAAEYVCGGDGITVLDALDGLLDKSVLMRVELGGTLGYRML